MFINRKIIRKEMPSNNGRKTQHTYRERAQPANRRRFGLLEKKKDWQARAKDHKNKKQKLLKLKRTAENRNPDEFYMGMVGKNLKNGKFMEQESSFSKAKSNKLNKNVQDTNQIFKNEEEEDAYLDELLAKKSKKGPDTIEEAEINFDDPNLLKTKDINFVRFCYQKEKKILSKMKKNLNFSDNLSAVSSVSSKNSKSHIRFASDDEEAEQINENLKLRKQISKSNQNEYENFKTTEMNSQIVNKKLLSRYREMSEQIEKVNKIKLILEKLENRRKVAVDNRMCRVIEKEGGDWSDVEDSGSYFWPTKRYK